MIEEDVSREGEEETEGRDLNLEALLRSLDLIWPKNAPDKNNKRRCRGRICKLLLCLGPRMPNLHRFGGEAPGLHSPAEGQSEKGPVFDV